MAQTRRTAGGGTRRRSEAAEASRAARSAAGRQSLHDRSAQGLDQSAADEARTAHEHTGRASAPGARGTRPQGESASAADMEQLQEMASEMAPQLGAAAVAAIATAVVVPEFLPAVLIGAGATLAPRLLPGLSYVFRPVMKTVMRAGYAAYSSMQHFAAEAGEQMQDVIAEAQAEQRTRARHRSHAAHAGSHQGTEAGASAH